MGVSFVAHPSPSHLPPWGRVTKRRVARGWETQEEMETQRGGGAVEVDLNLKRQRRTCKQLEGQGRRTDRPVR